MRQFFTLDLRGLRAALAARATRLGVNESDVVRSVLAAALATEVECVNAEAAATGSSACGALTSNEQVKLSTRMPCNVAARLDHNARTAGLSRGAYLARLIEAAPPVMSSRDRKAGYAALSDSAAELALLSRDIHHLTALLKAGELQAAAPYRDMLNTLDADVRLHLAQATSTLTDLSTQRSTR
jgi:plasmid stability protein